MTDFCPACGWRHLRADDRGQLPPSAAWLAGWLDRPELALVAESCPAEIQVPKAVARGVSVPLTLAHSGLTALARVLQRWVAHLSGVAVTSSPNWPVRRCGWAWR